MSPFVRAPWSSDLRNEAVVRTCQLAHQVVFEPIEREIDRIDQRNKLGRYVVGLRQPLIVQLLTMSLGEEQNAGQLLDQVAQPLMSVARMPASVE
jgi:hypothetical protein